MSNQENITTPPNIDDLIAKAVEAAMRTMVTVNAAKQETRPENSEMALMLAQFKAEAEAREKATKIADDRRTLVNKALSERRSVSELISREVRPGLNGGASYEQHGCTLKALLRAVKVFGLEAVESTISGKIKWTAPTVGCKFDLELPQEVLDEIDATLEAKYSK